MSWIERSAKKARQARSQRWLTVLGLIALVSSGCDPGPDAPISFGSSTTRSPTETIPQTTAIEELTLTGESTSTTGTSSESRPGRLVVRSVLLRFDGDTGEATFEVVVCNTGLPADDIGVRVSAGGAAIQVASDAALDLQMCAGYFAASSRLADFGVVGPGPTLVEVVVDDGGKETIDGVVVDVESTTVVAPPDQVAAYEQCLARGFEDSCEIAVPYAPLPGEVMFVDGQFLAIAPIEFEPLAVFALEDMENCLPRVEEFLGITGPRPISHRTIVSDFNRSFAGADGWATSQSLEAHLLALDELALGMWGDVMDGFCRRIAAHELTHLVEGNTPLSGWLDEGLARWMEDRSRSNSVGVDILRCTDDSWYDDWTRTWIPFSNLLNPEPGTDIWNLYQTGGCFWDYLDSAFGSEAVRTIARELAARRDPMWNGCSGQRSVFFIRDIVNPVVGTDISDVAESRWGIGATYTGCEGA